MANQRYPCVYKEKPLSPIFSDETHRFYRLNIDILNILLEEIRQSGEGLQSLSLTCIWLRRLCKPVMFRSIRRTLQLPIESRRRILTRELWRYVQYVHQTYRFRYTVELMMQKYHHRRQLSIHGQMPVCALPRCTRHANI